MNEVEQVEVEVPNREEERRRLEREELNNKVYSDIIKQLEELSYE